MRFSREEPRFGEGEDVALIELLDLSIELFQAIGGAIALGFQAIAALAKLPGAIGLFTGVGVHTFYLPWG